MTKCNYKKAKGEFAKGKKQVRKEQKGCLSLAYLPFACFFFFATCKLVFYKNLISSHQNLALLDEIFFFYKRNGYKLISG